MKNYFWSLLGPLVRRYGVSAVLFLLPWVGSAAPEWTVNPATDQQHLSRQPRPHRLAASGRRRNHLPPGRYGGQNPRFTPEGWLCQDLGKGIYAVRDRDGWVYRYLADGLPETLTSPSGRLLVFDYDNKKLLVRIIQAKDEKTRGSGVDVLKVSYNADSRPVKIISGNVEHRFVWDPQTGELLSWSSNGFLLGGLPDRVKVEEKRPESAPEIPAAKSDEKITGENGAAMGTIRFAYKNDLLYAIKPLDEKVERLTWDEKNARLLSDGEMTYAYDGAPDKIYTLTAMDKSQRKISVQVNVLKGEMTRTAPDGSSETTISQRHYAGNGLTSEKRDSSGQILLHLDYNQRHLPVDIRELGQPETRQAYDDHDRVTDVWRGPLPSMTELSLKISNAAPTAAASWGKLVQHLTYEGNSREPSTITDAKGQTTHLYYDAQLQLVRSVSPGGAEEKFAYDDWGRTVAHALPLPGVSEEKKYDAFGRTISSKSSDGHTSSYQFNPEGRLESRTEDGVSYSYQYDERGRPTTVLRNLKVWLKWTYGQEKITPVDPETKPASWPVPIGPIQVTTVAFTDPRGAITKRYYDEKGQLVEVVNPLKERTSYRYNADGENIGWADARGNGLVLTRDNMGRIVRQENAVGEILTWSFDAAGRVATRSNGVQTATYHYDTIGRLIQIDYPRHLPRSFSSHHLPPCHSSPRSQRHPTRYVCSPCESAHRSILQSGRPSTSERGRSGHSRSPYERRQHPTACHRDHGHRGKNSLRKRHQADRGGEGRHLPVRPASARCQVRG